MKAPWTKRGLSEEERRQWVVTARLSGIAVGLAVALVWALLRRHW
jgi:hypothetical protein